MNKGDDRQVIGDFQAYVITARIVNPKQQTTK